MENIMKKYDVVALGELLIDFTENGKSNQGNPLFEANPGGAPCNVLAMLTKLGHKTAFIGKVGEDFFGEQLRDAITEAGIDAGGLCTDKEIHTTLAMVPGESYVDSKAASIMGIYENTVDGMMTDYVFPQENGHHEQVKWFRIGDGKDGLLCKMEEKLGLNLANYTDESLEKAQHPFEIEKADDVIIHLDYRQSGLGSNSCGEEQLEENKVKLQDFAMAFTVQAAECGTEIREARKQYID